MPNFDFFYFVFSLLTEIKRTYSLFITKSVLAKSQLFSSLLCKDIYVTDESCNFIVEDYFALNCNLSPLLIFQNKRSAQWELLFVLISSVSKMWVSLTTLVVIDS